jgi:hypothetical protein
MEITKELAKVLHEDIKKAAGEVAAKHGLTLSPSNASYGNDIFRLKVEFAVPVSKLKDVPKVSQQMIDYGMAPRGTQVVLRTGETATIQKARRLKYEIEIDNKSYLIPFDACKLKK